MFGGDKELSKIRDVSLMGVGGQRLEERQDVPGLVYEGRRHLEGVRSEESEIIGNG